MGSSTLICAGSSPAWSSDEAYATPRRRIAAGAPSRRSRRRRAVARAQPVRRLEQREEQRRRPAAGAHGGAPTAASAATSSASAARATTSHRGVVDVVGRVARPRRAAAWCEQQLRQRGLAALVAAEHAERLAGAQQTDAVDLRQAGIMVERRSVASSTVLRRRTWIWRIDAAERRRPAAL